MEKSSKILLKMKSSVKPCERLLVHSPSALHQRWNWRKESLKFLMNLIILDINNATVYALMFKRTWKTKN